MIDMTLSPLQMKQLLFTKVLIEPFDFQEDANIWAPEFDFDGVMISCESMTSVKQGEEADPRNFLVLLKIGIPNNLEEGTPAPYIVDMHAQAIFEVSEGVDKDKRESIVSVNGASLIVGAMRELITQITGRSVYGPMTLPSLRFLPGQESSTDKK